jgi:hypothetical protein
MTHIVKVQRPLDLESGTKPVDGPWLAYDRTGRRVRTFDPTPAVTAAMGKSVKAYFEAFWVAGVLDIGRRVPDQDW